MNLTRTELSGGRLLKLSGLFLALLFLWVLVGPRQFGGSVSYVITQGDSMEPLFEEGDLVVTREAADYAVGDIIAAFDKKLQSPVLHRIIEEHEGRYITKGDNNDFIDEYEPKPADITGKKWLHVPGGGAFLRKVLTPFGTSMLIGGLSFIVARSRKEERDIPPTGTVHDFEPARRNWETPTQQLRWFAIPVGLALAYFLALGFFSFTRPVTEKVTRDASYAHSGRFGYSADVAKSSLYPAGKLRSGDVIHTDQVRKVTFAFEDAITSEEPLAMSGDAKLTAKLSTEVGWSRTFPLARTSWTDEASVSGELDVRNLSRLATKVATETGLSASFLLEVEATIEPQGFVAGEPAAEPFVAMLPFQVTADILQPILQTDRGTDALRPSASAVVEVTRPVAKTVDLLGMQLPVDEARKTSLLGSMGMLVLAAGFGVLYKRRMDSETESERILAKYGEWLVPVTTLESLEGLPSVPTSDIQGLIRMADRQGRMALYVVDRPEIFFFEQSGIVYYFATKDAPTPGEAGDAPSVAELPSVSHEHLEPESVENKEQTEMMVTPSTPSPEPKRKLRPRKISISTLDEAEKVALAYSAGRVVNVDLAGATPAAAKRITDFVGGLVYASGGRLQQDGKRLITLIPPADVHQVTPRTTTMKKSPPRSKSG